MNGTDLNPSEEMNFEILRSSAALLAEGSGAARLGRLAFPGRKPLDTPNFFTATSRGVVPHLTPDTVSRHDLVRGAYVAFEDFIERSQKNPTRIPPLLQTPTLSPSPRPLHTFTALPPTIPTVFAPRRVPATAVKLGNGQDFISVFTSTGVQQVRHGDYLAAVASLRPDVAVPMADLTFNQGAPPNAKRAARMADRTEDWLLRLPGLLPRSLLRESGTAVFAPTLPVPHAVQWEYLNRLAEDLAGEGGEGRYISGLAVYDVDIIPELQESYPPLASLPRLSLDPATNPHQILRQVALGADVLLLPFINAASEAGIAFTFTFPPPPPPPSSSPPPSSPASSPAGSPDAATSESSSDTSVLPLGTDLTLPAHAASLLPLARDCACATCATHHAAYLHHLLSAHEMLAWTLLQIHNHHVMASFFAGVRASLAASASSASALAPASPSAFDEQAARFAAAYEPDLPPGKGQPPRSRGYLAGKTRVQGASPPSRLNRPAWGKLGDVAATSAAAEAGAAVGGEGGDADCGVAASSGDGNGGVAAAVAMDVVTPRLEDIVMEPDQVKQTD